MDRRKFLSLSAIAGASAALGRAVPGLAQTQGFQPNQPLKAYGAPCGAHIGIQAERPSLQQPAFARFVTTNFNLMTAGNELKWGRLRPNPETYNFTDADWMVNFARQNNMLFHGHNLCWNTGNPGWMNSTLNKSNARQFLVDHITKVMGRYAGQVDSWDVVNEPFAVWMGRPDGLYKGVWLDLLGPEYVDIAFNAAAQADPKALRVMNVHHVEQDNPTDEKTRQLTLSFLQQIVKRGVPIQAVGIESHLDASSPIGGASYDRFIKSVRDLGLEVMFTEIDINDSQTAGAPQQRDQAVANYYFNYLTKVIPVSGAKRIIFWTPWDKGNWMDYLHTQQYARSDGARHRPGLLDENMQPKMAYSAVADALHNVCR
ncbi:MAG TPA: endo-1,4-beta-xylanase [Pseudacidobacterium sp.]|jgi:endo-1,4-beta-xylanase|nr:endo-1,4-beta-xylanase [Pseudacidobacterium sp.]